MKACILAGGQGTRLRPLTENVPKPMTRLVSRPVLEYILRLLCRQGFRDIAVTTAYLAPVIESAFGDGSEWGVRLRWYRESVPLGTAGSVRACADFLDGEDPFLVISGDCICDFTLSPALSLLRERDADAVLVLHHSPDPLEYGLVAAAPDGRAERFVEKPAWGQVCTDTVNTGIYFLSPRVLRDIPEGTACDFSCDLFPRLLARGTLYARALDGYWCDIGDCGAYLRCTRDLLEGRADPAAFGLSRFASDPPDCPGVTFYAPCSVADRVRIAPGAVIGPGTVLGEGASVGECAVVEGSVCDGAAVGAGAEVRGTVLCRGAKLGERARTEDGCVVGEEAVIGADAVLSGGVRVWPGQEIPAEARIRESVTGGSPVRALQLTEDAVRPGPLRPEDAGGLGMALAELTGGGTAALGCDASPVSDALLCAMESGIRACGGQVLRHDAAFEAVARCAVRLSHAAAGAFVTTDGGLTGIRLLSADGCPMDRAARRKLEGALLRRDVRQVPPASIGATRALTGLADLYRASVPSADCAGARVHVAGDGPAAVLLRQLLSDRGAALSAGAYVEWRPSRDGLTLQALDEDGDLLDDYALRAAERSLTDRPAPDALTLAVFLTAALAAGQSLAALRASMPLQASESRDLPLRHGRGEVMRELSALLRTEDTPYRPLEDGVGLSDGCGAARVQPLADRSAVRILAEAQSAEAAAELCGFLEDLVRRADEIN